MISSLVLSAKSSPHVLEDAPKTSNAMFRLTREAFSGMQAKGFNAASTSHRKRQMNGRAKCMTPHQSAFTNKVSVRAIACQKTWPPVQDRYRRARSPVHSWYGISKRESLALGKDQESGTTQDFASPTCTYVLGCRADWHMDAHHHVRRTTTRDAVRAHEIQDGHLLPFSGLPTQQC